MKVTTVSVGVVGGAVEGATTGNAVGTVEGSVEGSKLGVGDGCCVGRGVVMPTVCSWW